MNVLQNKLNFHHNVPFRINPDTRNRFQGCNFMKFSRGHVGPWTKNFRSPQENLRAHNEIRFIEEKYKRKSARHDVDHRILVNVYGFSGQSGNHAHTSTGTFSTGLILFEYVNNTACSGECFGIW